MHRTRYGSITKLPRFDPTPLPISQRNRVTFDAIMDGASNYDRLVECHSFGGRYNQSKANTIRIWYYLCPLYDTDCGYHPFE